MEADQILANTEHAGKRHEGTPPSGPDKKKGNRGGSLDQATETTQRQLGVWVSLSDRAKGDRWKRASLRQGQGISHFFRGAENN